MKNFLGSIIFATGIFMLGIGVSMAERGNALKMITAVIDLGKEFSKLPENRNV